MSPTTLGGGPQRKFVQLYTAAKMGSKNEVKMGSKDEVEMGSKVSIITALRIEYFGGITAF